MFWTRREPVETTSLVSDQFRSFIVDEPPLPPEIEAFLRWWTQSIEQFLIAYKAGEAKLDDTVDNVNQKAYEAIRMRTSRDKARLIRDELARTCKAEDRSMTETEIAHWDEAGKHEETITAKLRSIKLYRGDSLALEGK